MGERGVEIMLVSVPNEDETFLGRAALKYVKPSAWEKEKLR